jgi:hypothetical protein
MELGAGETVKSYYYPVTQFFVYTGIVAGAILSTFTFIQWHPSDVRETL